MPDEELSKTVRHQLAKHSANLICASCHNALRRTLGPPLARCRPFRKVCRYRDWVIDALKADMPYDPFVKKQFAGDGVID